MDSEQSDYPSSSLRLSDLPLRMREWFLLHRFQLRKWWVLVILVADTLLFAYVITTVFLYVVQGPGLEKGFVQRAQGLAPPTVLSEIKPSEVAFENVTMLPNDPTHADFIVQAENPNTYWMAEITSRFTDGTHSTAEQITRLAPGQSSYIYQLAQEWRGSGDSQRIQLQVLSVRWQRLIQTDRLENISFNVGDVNYTPAVAVPNSGQTFARVTAAVRNDSLYGFWTVRVPVILLQDTTPVAITTVLLRSFTSGETRQIEAQWLRNLPSNLQVVVLPEVDIFDEQNYMNLQ